MQERCPGAAFPGGAMKPEISNSPSFCDEAASWNPEQGPVTFKEVSVRFTEEGWALLYLDQRRLHQEVMEENGQNVASLGIEGTQNTSMGEPQQFLLEVKQHRGNTGTKWKRMNESSSQASESQGFDTHWRVHTGEKPYKCLECGKSFTQSFNYIAHQRIHAAEKPYKCLVCGKSMAQNKDFSAHPQIYTGKRPYKCLECGKSFTRSSHLTTHQRIHTGEKPYTCLEYGKSFVQKPHLVKHQKIHTVIAE